MLSALKRLKRLMSDSLARYFPHTTAYIQADRAAQAARHLLPNQSDLADVCAAKARPKSPAKAKAKPVGNRSKPTEAVVEPVGAAVAAPKGRASRAKAPKSEGVYGPALLAVTAQQVDSMKVKVAKAVAAGELAAPSDEQWAMIVGEHPLTRIFAGAGSGKSSTLVLRVLFMLGELAIAPEHMTVISFTNASCAELRERLLKAARALGYPLGELQVRGLVRTFHSAMAVQAKGLFGDFVWFEQMHEPASKQGELDNPLQGTRLRPVQHRLLKQVYQQCYSDVPRFAELVNRLLSEPVKTSASTKAPLKPFTLAGEFSPVPLFEAFYAQAGFIQSIGLNIASIDSSQLNCPEQERQFIEALQLYWQALERVLGEQGLLSFDKAFMQITERMACAQDVAQQLLEPFTHLLIDEFQDVSAQIVRWLLAVQKARNAHGHVVSLMAIGDDWQSIYGWRGSSPELFINFDRYFPCKVGRGGVKRSAVLNLANNYRSVEPIIRDAERLLQAVTCKQSKLSVAQRVTQKGDYGVRLVRGFDLNKDPTKLLEEITQQCEFAAQQSNPEATAVLLLSRRNEPLQAVSALLDKKLSVKGYTIHRAKGLQGQVAIILDDCWPAISHPLRNALYACSGLFSNTYDQAMEDESLRLGYVAITRGVSRVLWFCNKTQGATKILALK